jgi:hypothetical protein
VSDRLAGLATLALAGLLVGCGGGDGDGQVQPDTIATLSTAPVEEVQPPNSIYGGPLLRFPSEEPVAAPPEPIDACALIDDRDLQPLVGAVTATPGADGCRWEGRSGYVSIVVRAIPVGTSQHEAMYAFETSTETIDVDEAPFYGLRRLGVPDTQIEVFWGPWQATVASDLDVVALRDLLATVPEMSAVLERPPGDGTTTTATTP